jgi:hypothetical protein
MFSLALRSKKLATSLVALAFWQVGCGAQFYQYVKINPNEKKGIKGNLPEIQALENLSINEDTPTNPITFSLTKAEKFSLTCDSTTFTYTSSNTALVPSSGAISLSGTWPNCSAVITPMADAHGTATIGVAVTHPSVVGKEQSFTLTVNPVNDAPTMATISSPQTTAEETSKALTFTVGDVDGPLSCTGTNLLYTSDNAAVVNNNGSAVTWSGTWPNCTGTVAPVANANGSANITFQISDGTLTASQTFSLSVTPVNDAPTDIALTSTSVAENAGANAAVGTLSTTDPDAGDTHTYALVAGTGDTDNSAFTITGANLTLNASADSETKSSYAIRVRTTDNGTGSLTFEKQFTITITNVNDVAPTISDVANQSTNMNTPLTGVAITINDVDSALACNTALSVVSSSNTTLLPAGNIAFAGTAPNCTMGISPAYNQNATSTITIQVSDGNLTAQDSFDVVVHSGWYQEAYIKAANAEASDAFGGTVSHDKGVSLSGNTLVVGATGEDSNESTITNGSNATNSTGASNSGAAYVYLRSDNQWAQQAYIKAANVGASDQFGRSISLSGSTLAVSATMEDSDQNTITATPGGSDPSASNDTGAVYVYTRSGTTWALEAYIKAANPDAGDYFGTSVSLSGSTLAVGATGEDSDQTTITTVPGGTDPSTTNNTGAVYVYRRSGATWALEAYIKAANAGADDEFGRRISLSGDTLAVGAYKEDSNQTTITTSPGGTDPSTTNDTGAVYVYRRGGTTWGLEAYIKAANADAGDYFGWAVSLSGDTLAVGTYQEDSNQTTITTSPGGTDPSTTNNTGAVYIYRRSGTAWAPEAYIKSFNADSGDNHGRDLVISGDTLVANSYSEDSNQTTISNTPGGTDPSESNNTGAAYVYRRAASTWMLEAYIKSANAEAFDRFGTNVSLSGDTFVVSADGEDSVEAIIINGPTASVVNGASSSGAVYVYRNKSRIFDPDVRVTQADANSITFAWSANLGSTTQIKVAPVASGTGTPAANCPDGGAITLAAGTTSYTYSGLAAGTKYGFRFCAWDGANASGGATIWAETTP